MDEYWEDGICKTCGSIVEETSSDNIDSDYMNRCTNIECIENKWHYCYDDEELEYYKHN